MSGVCGLVRFDGGAVSLAELQRQTRAMAHLGPDKVEHWVDGSLGLAALLMRVTHEDAFDQQPLYDADTGLTLVSDARIDNREEVADLLGIGADALATMPDSAVIFAAYQAWGAACAERLVGDFVFVAWDAKARTLTLVRDQVGQRHLFFHKGDGFLAFATEKNGLWALPDVSRVLPDIKIAKRLMGEALRGRRPFDPAPPDGMAYVPGGCIVTVAADGAVALRRYWEAHAGPEHQNKDEAYYIEAYRRVLGEAVACRLRRATRPAGLLMSGGLDSSAISGLAGPVVTAQGRKLIAVSSVMPEGHKRVTDDAREWVEASRRVMPHLDVRYVTSEGLDIFAGMEASYLATGDGHGINHYLNHAMYAVIAKGGARIAMDGYGGDYTLNPQGQKFFVWLLSTGRWGLFIKEWGARRRFLETSHWGLFKYAVLRHAAAPAWRLWSGLRIGLSPSEPRGPLTRSFMKEAAGLGIRPRKRPKVGPISHLKFILDSLSSASHMGGSITAAVQGLEFTQPFHDKRVIELALAVPPELFMKNGRERHLSREAFKDLYPPELQTRKPGNDTIGPDLMMMARRIKPQALAEIERMEAAGKLNRYFDFKRMREMIEGSPGRRPTPATTQRALTALLRARYIEWFRGDNR